MVTLSADIKQLIGPTGLTDDQLVAAITSGDTTTGLALYQPGVIRGLSGMTATRADATTCATYVDAAGLVQTVAANVLRDAHYIGGIRYTLREGAATNSAIWNRDFTNAAWVKVTVTAAKDQTGADGVASSASSLLATGANATILQTLALAAATRFTSCYVKRITGAGVINMTTDGGVSWIAVTVTAGWTRVNIPAQSFLNPVFGFQIVTSGDKIAVDFFQNEAGPFQSSVIATTTVAVTRAADLWSFPWSRNPEAGTWYVDSVQNVALNAATNYDEFDISNAAGAVAYVTARVNGDTMRPNAINAHAAGTKVSAAVTTVAYGNRLEHRIAIGSTGAVTSAASINGAAEVVGATSTAVVLDATWSGGTMWIGSTGGTVEVSNFALRSLAYVPGPETSMASFRALTGG